MKIVDDMRSNPIDFGSRGQRARSTLGPWVQILRFASHSFSFMMSLKYYIFNHVQNNTVYREFVASGSFGKNDAWKVCFIFTESYFRYLKDSQYSCIAGFIFRCVYFWRFQTGREFSENFKSPIQNQHEKFPIYSKVWRYLLLILMSLNDNFLVEPKESKDCTYVCNFTKIIFKFYVANHENQGH